ncbi:MAG: hypothetical protein KIT68_01735 [Phycisphaeraceae bacterium]|nr:hypothetical protein [Phycisphaeraceae bacterium]
MSTRRVTVLVSMLGAAALALSAVAAFPPPGDKDEHKEHHKPAPAPALEPLKSLVGEWEATGPDGKRMTALVVKLTAAGSVVHETMFPGSEHEMVNVYHMDGEKVAMTHYCAIGNQPRMTSPPPKDGVYTFTLDKVSNGKPGQSYMGELVVKIKGDNLTQVWASFENGKRTEGPTIEMTRKKK